MLAGSLLANKHSMVFIAGNNKSVVEIVFGQLKDDFEKLIMHVTGDVNDIVNEFRHSYADVLILAFENIELSAQLSDALFKANRLSPLKPFRLLALCNKSNVKRAYALYGERLINDYIVYWPLTYDPYRLVLSVRQAVEDLKYNDDAKLLLHEVSTLKKELAQLKGEHERLLQESRYTGVVSSQPLEDPMDQLSSQPAGHEIPLEAVSALSTPLKHQHKTLLVVDDDEFQRSVLRRLLMAERYDVKFAENGVDALDMMRQRQYDLVLLDLLMPGMSGLDVMQQIRVNPGLALVPVIIISGEHEKETVVECLKLGASGYVVKPYTRKTLLEKIDKALA